MTGVTIQFSAASRDFLARLQLTLQLLTARCGSTNLTRSGWNPQFPSFCGLGAFKIDLIAPRYLKQMVTVSFLFLFGSHALFCSKVSQNFSRHTSVVFRASTLPLLKTRNIVEAGDSDTLQKTIKGEAPSGGHIHFFGLLGQGFNCSESRSKFWRQILSSKKWPRGTFQQISRPCSSSRTWRKR